MTASCAYCDHPDVLHDADGECRITACRCFPPCWICNRPNERARGYDDPNEAEACGACEREYAASVPQPSSDTGEGSE